MPSKQVVEEFIATVVSGHHVEAIERFYATYATMQENGNPPRHGLANLVANERAALARNKEIVTRPVDFYAIDGNRVVIHWIFDITTLDGKRCTLDELSLQRWDGDKVVEERFYYDPAQLRAV
jgi:ketosteroid isomerase-like protein